MNKKMILGLSIFFLFIAMLLSVSASEIYYSFNQNDIDGTTLIDSQNNDNGTINGMADTTAGLLNGSGFFDGNDYIDDFDLPQFDTLPNGFTISFWVNLTNVDDLQYVFQDHEHNRILIREPNTGDLQFKLWDSADNDELLDSSVTFGQYEHWIVSWNKSNGYMEMWKNGVSQGTVHVGTNLKEHSTGDTAIGVEDFGSKQRYLNGNLDEFSFWEYSFNNQNVSDLYNSGNGYNPFDVSGGAPPVSCSFTLDNDLINNTVNYNDDNITFYYNVSFSE